MKDFLPISKQDMKKRGIEQLDFVYVIGDAYVDHSSFGPAIISRVLEANGYTVGIISQPDWKDKSSINALGEPRLAFLISSGNMDSMVNHYFVSKKHRPTDAYTPGGVAGKRPDHATVVYSNLIRQTYKDKAIVIGGIEASLRRLAHYDYWSDSYKRSILLDSGANLLIYGMGERAIVEVADALNSGIDIKDISFIRGTVYKARDLESASDYCLLPDYELCKENKSLYAMSYKIQHENTDSHTGKTLVEKYPHDVFVIQNPPQFPLSVQEMDDVYALPYMNDYHPSYKALGGVPAIDEIKFSITSNRGCFGGCNFCALTFHQGRTVQVRSHESILQEAKSMTEDRDFKGYIHDVGGPTADFRFPSCDKQLSKGVCKNRQCLTPKPCPNLKVDHQDYLELLRKLRALPKVKKVFIRSGIRFDYMMLDKDDSFFRELIKYHISGQLRVAPEHICDNVLNAMGKPSNDVYEAFIAKYNKLNDKLGTKQFVVPYLMSSHPGSTLKDAIELAEYIRDIGYMPEQVQDYYPTPSTVSTVMYYTGINPLTNEEIYVCRNPHEKAMQRALIQYKKPENYQLVKEALIKCHREDLIGFDKHCLIPPRLIERQFNKNTNKSAKDNRNQHESNKSPVQKISKNSRDNSKTSRQTISSNSNKHDTNQNRNKHATNQNSNKHSANRNSNKNHNKH